MNKQILIVVLVLTCIMFLNGCYTSDVKPEEVSSVVNMNVESQYNSEANSKQPEGVDVDYGEIGFELQAKESLFVLNNSQFSTDIIRLFGEPENKSEPVEWEADGLEHQEWYYNSKGIEIGFVRDDKNNLVVFSIDLRSPCNLKTSRGISIGSTRSEVQRAYEHEINPNDDGIESETIVVGTVYGGLIFAFENDKVSSIFIGAAAE